MFQIRSAPFVTFAGYVLIQRMQIRVNRLKAGDYLLEVVKWWATLDAHSELDFHGMCIGSGLILLRAPKSHLWYAMQHLVPVDRSQIMLYGLQVENVQVPV